MTPKEKATELLDKYKGSEGILHIQLKLTGFTEVKRKAKIHALIVIEEVLKLELTTKDRLYWGDVYQEIKYNTK